MYVGGVNIKVILDLQ